MREYFNRNLGSNWLSILKKIDPCIYRVNVATRDVTLSTLVLLPLDSQWQGEQMSFSDWGPFFTRFWLILSKEVYGGSFVGTDGSLEISISERSSL